MVLLGLHHTQPQFPCWAFLSVLLSFLHSPPDPGGPRESYSQDPPPQAGSPLPGAGGEALPQVLEKAEREGMWSAAGFHGLFPGHDNHI